MLDKLDLVDWNKLSKTESGAAEVPIFLREIASERDEGVLNWKLKALYDRIVHQGGIFLHSVYTIPIIIDILRYDEKLRVVMVSLLAQIAICSPLVCEDLTYQDIAIQARHEIGKGIDVYLSLLKDNRPFLRQRTLELMAQLREYAPQLRPSLLAMLESENDEQRAAEIRHTLMALG